MTSVREQSACSEVQQAADGMPRVPTCAMHAPGGQAPQCKILHNFYERFASNFIVVQSLVVGRGGGGGALTSTARLRMPAGRAFGVGGRSPVARPVVESTFRFSASSRLTVSGCPGAAGAGGSGLLVMCPFARLPCPEPCHSSAQSSYVLTACIGQSEQLHSQGPWTGCYIQDLETQCSIPTVPSNEYPPCPSRHPRTGDAPCFGLAINHTMSLGAATSNSSEIWRKEELGTLLMQALQGGCCCFHMSHVTASCDYH